MAEVKKFVLPETDAINALTMHADSWKYKCVQLEERVTSEAETYKKNIDYLKAQLLEMQEKYFTCRDKLIAANKKLLQMQDTL